MEVAERSGVHDTSIYRRWGTEAQLVAEAVKRNAAQNVPPPDTGTFQGDIGALSRGVLARLDSPLGRAVSQVVVSQDPGLLGLRQQYWNSRMDGVKVIVARAAKRGEVPESLDPRLVMEICHGPIMLRRISGQPITPRYVKALLDRLIPVQQKHGRQAKV